jgi:hypothetical protein
MSMPPTKRITRPGRCLLHINGTFRAPWGIPDLIDRDSLKLVFTNSITDSTVTLDFLTRLNRTDPSCWTKPGGCPLNTTKSSPLGEIVLDPGIYIISIEATWKPKNEAGKAGNVVLCYYTKTTPLGTHDRHRATPVVVDGPYNAIVMNPTIEMNLDRVL